MTEVWQVAGLVSGIDSLQLPWVAVSASKGPRVSTKATRATVTVATAVVVATSLSGCGLFGGSSAQATGVTANPKGSGQSTGQASGSAGAATPSATSGATPGATASSVASAVPSLRPKPGAGKASCDASSLSTHLSLAGGAVHTYLAKSTGTQVTVIALKNASTREVGAKAASFAANQLIAGVTATAGCATTPALSSVIRQTSAYLVKLSTNLKGKAATAAQVSSAEALMADINAQAGRIGLKVTDTVTPVAKLV